MTTSNAGTGDRPLEERLERLIQHVGALGGGREHRREELVERAESSGLDRLTAEQVYDIAVEERLEPAYGMAVVLEGVSVRPFEGARPDADASEPTEPEWVDEPPDPDAAVRERRLRQTFRRLRAAMDDSADAGEALAAFVRAPDLEAHDYD